MTCPGFLRSLRWPLAALTAVLALASGRAEVAFQTEVAAVISKAGCNLGTCHGNATGKGGFKLSLRGGDLDYDYAALVQDQFGRRVNGLAPDQSLLLLKAINASPHGGGQRDRAQRLHHRTGQEDQVHRRLSDEHGPQL